MAANSLTVTRLRELLDYSTSAGTFTRKVQLSSRGPVGARADKLHTRGKAAGYFYVKVDGRRYAAHRLAWFYVHGTWPEGEIDHVDGEPGNNSLANLRDVSASVNQQNRRRKSSSNTSGFLGVSYKKPLRKWLASLTVSGRQVFLGYHETPQEAHQAYLDGKRKIHEGCTL